MRAMRGHTRRGGVRRSGIAQSPAHGQGPSLSRERQCREGAHRVSNALQIVPTDSEVRYENGVVDEKLGNVREAAQFYQAAIDTNADNAAARASLGRLFVLTGAPDKALAAVKPSLDKHPDDAALLTVRAAARAQLKDTDGALKDAERAVQLAPNSEDAVATLAGIYKSAGQLDKSRALLEDAVSECPRRWICVWRWHSCMRPRGSSRKSKPCWWTSRA